MIRTWRCFQLRASGLRFLSGTFPLLLLILMTASGCSRGALLDRAQAAWDSGDYEKSAQFYEEFLKENPGSEQAAMARYRVATICQRDLKQYDRAIQHFIHVIEDYPKSPDAWQARIRLSECYAAVGKNREAIIEYESALNMTQDAKEKRRLRLNIADLYYDTNDLGQAVAEYGKVVENAPYDELSERAFLRIGGIRLLRDEFEEAIPAYQTVADKTADKTIRRVARYGLTDCYERTFQYDQAVRMLEETEPDPSTPEYIKKRIESIREHQRNRNLNLPSSPGWPGRR